MLFEVLTKILSKNSQNILFNKVMWDTWDSATSGTQGTRGVRHNLA